METQSPNGQASLKTDMAGDGVGVGSETVRGGLQQPHLTVFAQRALATSLTATAILSAVVLRWFHLGETKPVGR